MRASAQGFSLGRLAWLATLVAHAGWATAGEPGASPPKPSAQVDWQPAEDGRTVVDHHNGQIWARCVEGMNWDGQTCRGQAVLASHKEALALAAARRKADGLDWRLPRVTELRRLVSETNRPRGLYARLFPAAPADWYWAGTTNVEGAQASVNQYNYANISRGVDNAQLKRMGFLHGWAVDMSSGEARGDMPKRTSHLPVRLVRSQD
ncbi:MAG: DUF1566 domain-containing protein [Burkholderiales bacterium]|jgi:hypothetical protein|nr:MAG: DUF1566 domain-containing protein [Burkholderiales bacterium]